MKILLLLLSFFCLQLSFDIEEVAAYVHKHGIDGSDIYAVYARIRQSTSLFYPPKTLRACQVVPALLTFEYSGRCYAHFARFPTAQAESGRQRNISATHQQNPFSYSSQGAPL